MVADDWETFRLDNWESEVVGGACGMTVHGYVSKRDMRVFCVMYEVS